MQLKLYTLQGQMTNYVLWMSELDFDIKCFLFNSSFQLSMWCEYGVYVTVI